MDERTIIKGARNYLLQKFNFLVWLHGEKLCEVIPQLGMKTIIIHNLQQWAEIVENDDLREKKRECQ